MGSLTIISSSFTTPSEYTSGSGIVVGGDSASVSSSVVFFGGYAINSPKVVDCPAVVDSGQPVFDYGWAGGAITVEMKLKWSADNNDHTDYGRIGKQAVTNQGWSFLLDASSPRKWGILLDAGTNVSIDSGFETTDGGSWYDFCFVSNNGHQELFVNGLSKGSGSVSEAITGYAVSDNLKFGTAANTGQQLSCSIAQFRMSDKILYSSNYTPSASYTVTGNTRTLLNFDENSGSLFHDEVVNGISGSLNSGSWVDGSGAGSIVTYATESYDVYRTNGNSIPLGTVFCDFSASEGINNGSIKYQLSQDGSLWRHFDGTNWVSASYSQSNDESTINTNIFTYPVSGSIYVRSFLISDGTQIVELDEIQLTYATGAVSGAVAPTPTPAETDWYLRNFTLQHLQGSPTILDV
jgi:hypothetical protein